MSVIALLILFPLFMIILLLFVGNRNIAGFISIAASFILLIISVYLFFLVEKYGVITLQAGGWKAPFGISLVLDYFSAILLNISSLIVFAISIYVFRINKRVSYKAKFYIFFFSIIMGVNGAFITGDVFNLFVWFEVILLSSFVLITLGSKKVQLEGGIKYMALNLIGSLLFLAGLGLLYGKTGTLNMAHLALILRGDNQSLLMNTSAILFFVAFGLKSAIFPLFFWLPSSYHTTSISVSALFAGLLTKVGVYALIRFFTLFFVQDQAFWHNLLLVLAGFTMMIGGMAASAHYDTRRILSYHIISQIGYMVMGLGIFTPLAIAGAIFFIAHNMIAKTNAFLIAGLINKLKGSYDLKNVGGLLKDKPILAILFIIPAFALAGIPPLSGFFAKFILIKAAIQDHHYIIIAVAIITSMLTLYSMLKIWNEAFLKKQPETIQNKQTAKLKFGDLFPSVLLALASVFMGIFAAQFFDFTMNAANQLVNPENYIRTILNPLE